MQLIIANPASGPGATQDADYVSAIASMRAAGVLVLGYVDTSYGRRFSTQVKSDIDKWYTWYAPDGIFLDEAANSARELSYYRMLYGYVKGKGGRAIVTLNPGTSTLESYTTASDILVLFEDVYANYVGWSPSSWTTRDPATRFWHLVYSTTAAEMPNAVSLAKNRNAGYIYVTDGGLPNPWGTLPADPYWSQELADIAKP